MRLCIVTPNLMKGDGQGRVNYEVAREAVRRGHRLTLVASAVGDTLADRSKVEVVLVNGRRPQLRYDVAFRRRSARWLHRNRHRFDLIMANGSATAADADVNAVHFTYEGWWRTPNHTWKTEKTVRSLYHLLHTNLQRGWERRAFLRSKWHIAVSRRIKEELIELGVNDKSVAVIYNGVDLHEFKPGPSRRTECALPLDVPLALFVGDIRLNRKNLATVLKGLTSVPGLHLAVAGDVRRSPFPTLAQSLGLGGRVHFLGARSDIAEIMRSCDFFVLPSFYEPFSLAVLEALASGLPVIVSNQVGASEIVTEGCGFVLPRADDIQALASAMRLCAADGAHRARMGAAARQIAEQHSWSAKAAQYLDFLESCVRPDGVSCARPDESP